MFLECFYDNTIFPIITKKDYRSMIKKANGLWNKEVKRTVSTFAGNIPIIMETRNQSTDMHCN